MLLPDERCWQIQGILKSGLSIERKAKSIEIYYESKIPYNRNRMAKQEKPPMHYHQIRMELEKRGEDLTPVEVEL